MRVGLDARLAGAGLGVSRLIFAMADELPRRGADVVWLGAADLAPQGIGEVAPPPGPGFAGLDSARGRRMARDLHLDLVHFAANSGWWTPGPTPFVLTVHDVIWARSSRHERNPRQLLGHAYLRLAVPRALRLAGAVACPSATAASALAARYGGRAEVIPNGVGHAWRTPVPIPGHAEPYIVAFAGRDARKATDVVIETCRRLPTGVVGCVLLAGAGIPSELQPDVDRLQKTGRLQVRGYLDEAELVATVAGALALLYPSRDEGFGLPVAEAMAAGVPVITGLAPVTLEIGGDAVLKLDPGDPAGSAVAAIRQLLDQPKLRKSLADQGRERSGALTWERVADAYAELYEEVLGGRRRRGPACR